MPQILVEFAVDTNLFRLLYSKPLDDLQFDNTDTDNPQQSMRVHVPVNIIKLLLNYY